MISPQSTLFARLYLWAEKQATLMVFLSLTLMGIAGWGLKYSKLELDIYDVYDENFQSSIDLFGMRESYKDSSQMLVAFGFSDVPTGKLLCKILGWSRRLSGHQEISALTSVWSLRAPKVHGDKVWYPKSLTDPCLLPPHQTIDLESHFANSFFRHLVSTTGSRDLVFDISFTAKETGMKQVQHVMDETDSYVARELPGVVVKYLGSSASRYYFEKIMVRDSIFNFVILLLMLLMMRAIYGTWRSGFYLALTLIASNLILYGVMGWIGIPINILTCNLFLMTAVAATADFMFVTHAQLKDTYRASILNLIRPCFFTTLTTVIGFISLNSSDLTIIRQFGNAAALGALAEWTVMFFCLPAFLRIFKSEEVWVDRKRAAFTRFLEKIERLQLPTSAMGVLIPLMILSVPAFFFLNDQDSPVKNLPSSHVLRRSYEDFKKKFRWDGQVFLYFPDQVSPVEYKKIISELSKFSQIYRIEDPAELMDEWTKGLPPLRQDLIRRELSMTPLWERYYSTRGPLRVPLYLFDQDLHSLRMLDSKVNQVCRKLCRLAGQRVVYLEYGDKISKTMIQSFGVSILLVLSILTWLLRSEGKLRYFVPVSVSSLMGPLVTLTMMSILQVPVTLVTSIFLAVMVGLAGDNAIQYLLASDGDLISGIENRSHASIMVTIVMIAASSMFLLETLLPVKILGCLFVFGFLINLVGDLWGLKGLLARRD